MNIFRYCKNLIYGEKKDEIWTSVLVAIEDKEKLILDSGYIIIGNLPINYYTFFCNFRNFTIINEELYYKYPDCIRKINPETVYLHIRTGISPYSIPFDKSSYWNIHFTSLNNGFYQKIKEELKEKRKFKIIKTEKSSLEKVPKISEAINPLFYIRNQYNNESILFNYLNINHLYF